MDKGYLFDKNIFIMLEKIGHSYTKKQTKHHSEKVNSK